MSSAICLNLDQSKILSSGNGLRQALPIILREGTGNYIFGATIDQLLFFSAFNKMSATKNQFDSLSLSTIC